MIFLTATSNAQERPRLAALDVRGILAKPFSPPALAGAVRRLLDASL